MSEISDEIIRRNTPEGWVPYEPTPSSLAIQLTRIEMLVEGMVNDQTAERAIYAERGKENEELRARVAELEADLEDDRKVIGDNELYAFNLKGELEQARQRIAELEAAEYRHTHEVKQFNDGFEAFKQGVSCSDPQRYTLDTDQWLVGWSWAQFVSKEAPHA